MDREVPRYLHRHYTLHPCKCQYTGRIQMYVPFGKQRYNLHFSIEFHSPNLERRTSQLDTLLIKQYRYLLGVTEKLGGQSYSPKGNQGLVPNKVIFLLKSEKRSKISTNRKT